MPIFSRTRCGPFWPTVATNATTKRPRVDLRVDSKLAFEKGGKHGPVVVPGDPEKSLLIQAVQQTGDLKMPKGGKLKAG
jgi:hypothetical protein